MSMRRHVDGLQSDRPPGNVSWRAPPGHASGRANLVGSLAEPAGISQPASPAGSSLLAEYGFLLRGHLDAATLARAAEAATRWRAPIHRVLIDLGWIGEADYAAALATWLGVGRAAGRRLSVASQPKPRGAPLSVLMHEAGAVRIVVPALAWQPAMLAGFLADMPQERARLLIATSAEIAAAGAAGGREQAALGQAVSGLVRLAPEFSARRAARPWQLVALALTIAGVAMGLAAEPFSAIGTALVALSIPFLCMAAIRTIGLIALLRHGAAPAPPATVERIPDADLPGYTVMVALYREAAVLPRLLRNLALLDYPATRLQILLALEETDTETRAAAAALDLPGNVRVVVVPPVGPRTKPKALNYALAFAEGEFVAIYDAEDRPEPDQLRKALAKFRAAGADLACVQAALNTYNPRASFLTRMFTIEYTMLFDALLPALERLRLPLPLGGTSNHFRTHVLRRVGAWDPYNVTEDADLGVRLARLGYRTGTIVSTTWEEAPFEFDNWLRQRTRWLKGWMQTYLVHTRRPVRLLRELGLRSWLGLHVLMFAILVAAVVHPLIYLLIGLQLWLATTPAEPGLDRVPQSWPLILAAANLALGLLSTVGLGLVAVARRGWWRLSLWAPAMPAYWLLISFAAYRALVHLVVKPHHWEKTRHGEGLRTLAAGNRSQFCPPRRPPPGWRAGNSR